MTPDLTPAGLRALQDGVGENGAEFALIDVREEAEFGESHLFWAACIPLSRIETRFSSLVPRRSTRVVLCDAGRGEARLAARKLAGFGYANVSVLTGGTGGWKASGGTLYSGVNVPSKAFGEFVERRYETPSVSAEELYRMGKGRAGPLIVDSRPFDEFQRMSIPGGVDCPGAELVYRVPSLAGANTPAVVVNCAGRTRSIIGAQSLINAGLPNRVAALRNGTMGWELAGLALDHGQERRAAAPTAEGLAWARAAAGRVARRFGVRTVNSAQLARWRGEAERRTLYLLDARQPEEFEAGHLPGSRSAPGGQLVQATDEFMPVRGARAVLVDDHAVRATMTASWLIQLGWGDTFVLEGGLREPLARGVEPDPVLAAKATLGRELAPEALSRLLAGNAAVVADLSSSRAYRRGHIPGAWFLMRAHLQEGLARLPKANTLVLTSEDGALAWVAVSEIADLRKGHVQALAGGNAAWSQAGLPLEPGETRMATPAADLYAKPYERGEGTAAAMRSYLTWEVELLEHLAKDDEARFRYFPPG